MEVIELRSAHLSNAEVLQFLKEVQQDQVPPSVPARFGFAQEDPLDDLRSVEKETIAYLEGTPASSQTEPEIAAFMQALRSYDLTKAEKLMLLNVRPKSTAELNALIECIEDRFSDDQQEAMVAVVHELLPYEEPEAEGAGEEMEGVEGADGDIADMER
ncbi:RNA polymerase Rpb4-domain-containing protein [Fimicolochytrium jonesii]|uniref:RNA polymerase Rpb4-domain-containing protein n=1 Tax=Fimicolochytrium jonesii TaxID=1396493 RepID=UPI0022FE5C42|nr:RNA polymerase Rpb4-domain-containing protein [Fimicolochytrium jonesii]KAI8826571.1 RNA polymerase Rpb4-domain-containing protein [Fimicolochytrium jonesii]